MIGSTSSTAAAAADAATATTVQPPSSAGVMTTAVMTSGATPPRHNYAHNSHTTPIASAKRPRQQQQQQQAAAAAASRTPSSSALTPRNTSAMTATTMTPSSSSYSSPTSDKPPLSAAAAASSAMTMGSLAAAGSNSSNNNNALVRSSTTAGTAMDQPNTPSAQLQQQHLSPMHRIKPVPRNAHGTTTTTTTVASPLAIMDDDHRRSNDGNGSSIQEPIMTDTNNTNSNASTTQSAKTSSTFYGETESTSSWVGRKVDALFSPVLNFFNQEESNINSSSATSNNSSGPVNGVITNNSSNVKDHMHHPTRLQKQQFEHEDDDDTFYTEKKNSEGDDVLHLNTNVGEYDRLHHDEMNMANAIMMMTDGDDDDSELHHVHSHSYGTNQPHHHSSNNSSSSTNSLDHSLHNRLGNTATATADSDDDMSLQAVEQPDADSEDFNPWQFIKSLPPYEQVLHLVPRVALPPKAASAPDVTVVLDLDETLVHCTVDPVPNPDLTFPVNFHGTIYTVHVRLRPHLMPFLQACCQNYEVIVFTASQQVYANELLNRIDPEGKFIQHRLYREACLQVEGNFLKDLNVLGRDLARTVLVDNSPHAFGYQINNGIPIESWFDDPNDRELVKLERFLRQLPRLTDVRTLIRDKFQSERAVRDAPSFLQ